MGGYLWVFFNPDLDSPCFVVDGMREEQLKACAGHGEIRTDFP